MPNFHFPWVWVQLKLEVGLEANHLNPSLLRAEATWFSSSRTHPIITGNSYQLKLGCSYIPVETFDFIFLIFVLNKIVHIHLKHNTEKFREFGSPVFYASGRKNDSGTLVIVMRVVNVLQNLSCTNLSSGVIKITMGPQTRQLA